MSSSNSKRTGPLFGRFPERCLVTAFTLRTVAALVLVVFLVAGDTGVWSHDLPGHRLCMAIVTRDSLMAAIELELCAGVMIEVPNLPVSSVVAIFAL